MTSLGAVAREAVRSVRRGALDVADRIGPQQSLERRTDDARTYWSDPSDPSWHSNSHWRDAFTEDETWHSIGRGHLDIYRTFARALGRDEASGRVIEWGAGGGANAIHFAPAATEFVAVDISPDSVQECRKQVSEVCDTPFRGVVCDIDHPERALIDTGGGFDLFLCYYVLELVPSVEHALQIVRIASQVLADDGFAVIQIKYRTADPATQSRRRAYRRNLANMTTFGIDEFWLLAAENGLVPRVVTLVPANALDERYAHYALTNASRGWRFGSEMPPNEVFVRQERDFL